MIRIALDAMGGDNAPAVEVEGVSHALRDLPAGFLVQLVGQREPIERELDRIAIYVPSPYNNEWTRARLGNNRKLDFRELSADQFEDFWRIGCFGGFLVGREAARRAPRTFPSPCRK